MRFNAMFRSRIAAVGAGIVGLSAVAAPALAQPVAATPMPATAPDGRAPGEVTTVTNPPVGPRGPGIDSQAAVNPAPGAAGPYVGHPDAFYETQARVDRVQQRIERQLAGRRRRSALSGIRRIRGEIATQKARHGEMRDWDREHVNRELDQLLARYGLQEVAAR